jgi:hypothetical protein
MADFYNGVPWYAPMWYYWMDWGDMSSRWNPREYGKEFRTIGYGEWSMLPHNTRFSTMMGGFSLSLRKSARLGGWGLENGDFCVHAPLWGHRKRLREERWWEGYDLRLRPRFGLSLPHSFGRRAPRFSSAFPFFHNPRPRFVRAPLGAGWGGSVCGEFVETGSLFFARAPKKPRGYYTLTGNPYGSWVISPVWRKFWLYPKLVIREFSRKDKLELNIRRSRFETWRINQLARANRAFFRREQGNRGPQRLAIWDTDIVRRDEFGASREPWNDRYFSYLSAVHPSYPSYFLRRDPGTGARLMPSEKLWGLWPSEDSTILLWTGLPFNPFRWDDMGTHHVGTG